MTLAGKLRDGGGGRHLSARTLQIFGLLLIAGVAVFWALTSRESALIAGIGVTLSTLGWVQGAISRAEDRMPRYAQSELKPEERDEVRKARDE